MPNESGIGALRVNFVRETIPGTTQADPAWLRFSDEVMSVGNWAPNTNLAVRRAVGTPDVTGFSIGAEDHEIPIAYRLQRWLTTASQVPNDAIADGLLRDSDGFLINTHSLLTRQTLPGEGTDSAGLRVFTYGTGGKFATARISADPSDSMPVLVEGGYRFEKARSHEVSQPTASTTMTIVSSNAGDTTQSVTIEDEGAGTSETIALNGTTPVVGASSFADIDAFRLDLETLGDITITFTTGGNTCGVILGSVSQQDIEGDFGLPLLGSGSFETALGTAFEHILGDTITKGGSPLDVNIMPMAIEVANNLDVRAVTRRKAKVITEGNRLATATATLFSTSGSHDDVVAHLKATAGDIVWTMTGGAVTVPSAVLTGPGGRIHTEGAAIMDRNNTFTGTGLTITP